MSGEMCEPGKENLVKCDPPTGKIEGVFASKPMSEPRLEPFDVSHIIGTDSLKKPYQVFPPPEGHTCFTVSGPNWDSAHSTAEEAAGKILGLNIAYAEGLKARPSIPGDGRWEKLKNFLESIRVSGEYTPPGRARLRLAVINNILKKMAELEALTQPGPSGERDRKIFEAGYDAFCTKHYTLDQAWEAFKADQGEQK